MKASSPSKSEIPTCRYKGDNGRERLDKMDCEVCKKRLVKDFDYGENGMTWESRYYCPDNHFSINYNYGVTEVSVFGKSFFFSYLTKEDKMRKIQKNISDFIQWKSKQ